MVIPTEQEVYELALHNPTIHAVLTMLEQGHLSSFDEAMRVCVVELAKVVAAQNDRIFELLSTMPPQPNKRMQPT